MTARSTPTEGRLTRAETGLLIERWIRRPLSALAFWSAITLPVLYLPLLATGPDTTGDLITFLALLGLHVLALIGGRNHNRELEYLDNSS